MDWKWSSPGTATRAATFAGSEVNAAEAYLSRSFYSFCFWPLTPDLLRYGLSSFWFIIIIFFILVSMVMR